MKGMASNQIVALIRRAKAQDLKSRESLEKFKRAFAKMSQASSTVKNSEIVRTYRILVESGVIKEEPGFERLIKNKEVRTGSGVAPVAILTKPYPCPGQCTFCPTEPGMPKSYLSNEPATMRAINNDFDPARQVLNRLEQYRNIGHSTDKIELIILGGTFSAYPKPYKQNFIKGCFLSCNGRRARDLYEAQNFNETARHKIVCLSIETRPDAVTEEEVRFLRRLGVTKIQLGVQTINDHILDHVKRGHGTAQVVRATQLLKDAGFKICYHMMTNLPLSTPDLDYQVFKEIFFNPDFKPDALKIYPCVVLKQTELYHEWLAGDYQPYPDGILGDLILKIKKITPEYVRIDRIYRDIPKQSIMAGSTISNIREVLKKHLEKQGVTCQCIRCREIKATPYQEEVRLKISDYEASFGKEYFLSFVDKDNKLYAILRLRIPSQIFSGERHFIEELQGAAIIREMHTYGVSLKVGELPEMETQHRGLGTKLLFKAEKIVRDLGVKRLAVIAGVGVRNYFRKFGYELAETYMVKAL